LNGLDDPHDMQASVAWASSAGTPSVTLGGSTGRRGDRVPGRHCMGVNTSSFAAFVAIAAGFD